MNTGPTGLPLVFRRLRVLDLDAVPQPEHRVVNEWSVLLGFDYRHLEPPAMTALRITEN